MRGVVATCRICGQVVAAVAAPLHAEGHAQRGEYPYETRVESHVGPTGLVEASFAMRNLPRPAPSPFAAEQIAEWRSGIIWAEDSRRAERDQFDADGNTIRGDA